MGIPDPSLLAGSPTMAGPASMAAQPVAEQEVEAEMGPVVTIMKPILRFLQLLCENHNTNLQVRSRPGDLTGGAGENLLFVLVRIRFVDWSHSAPSGALHNRVLSGLQNHKA